MPIISHVWFARAVTFQDANYLVFVDTNDHSIKLNIVSRVDVDSLVANNNQMDIVNSAQTILTNSQYGGGKIEGIDLYADLGTGIVRLSVITSNNNGWNLYMGRVESGNYVACANTPISIDGNLLELGHVNGNSSEINFLLTSNDSVYCEGH